MRARFIVLWEDIDWEAMATACGCTSARLEPREDRRWDLHVEGTEEAIGCLANDFSFGPEEVHRDE